MMVSCLFVSLFLSLIALSLSHYVPVPGGFAWNDCVHRVPDGSHIHTSLGQTSIEYPDGTTKYLSRCPYPKRLSDPDSSLSSPSSSSPSAPIDAEGWQAWASYNIPSNVTFTRFVGNYSVPNEPKSSSKVGIIFLFMGLQNSNWASTPSDPSPIPPAYDVLQSVLQYGNTQDGGGAYWGIASWYSTFDDNYIASKLKKVNTGDTVEGSLINKGGDTWLVGTNTNQEQSNIRVTKDRLISQPWAYVTFEVYNIDSCDQFPASNIMQYSDLLLETAQGIVSAEWQTFTGPKNNPCNSEAVVRSPADIEIDF